MRPDETSPPSSYIFITCDDDNNQPLSFHSREIKLHDTSAARVSRGLPGIERNAWPRPNRKRSSSSLVAYERVFN